jgi:hypothetical protein
LEALHHILNKKIFLGLKEIKNMWKDMTIKMLLFLMECQHNNFNKNYRQAIKKVFKVLRMLLKK